MLDYMTMISMAFALLVIMVIGGFVLCLPIARRLGVAVDEWVKLRRRESSGEIPAADLTRLGESVEAMREELDRIAARQEFVESLLEKRGEPIPGAERARIGTSREVS